MASWFSGYRNRFEGGFFAGGWLRQFEGLAAMVAEPAWQLVHHIEAEAPWLPDPASLGRLRSLHGVDETTLAALVAADRTLPVTEIAVAHGGAFDAGSPLATCAPFPALAKLVVRESIREPLVRLLAAAPVIERITTLCVNGFALDELLVALAACGGALRRVELAMWGWSR
jgi:hypothetical protein